MSSRAPITCCMVDGRSTVFYVDDNGWISSIVSVDEVEPDGKDKRRIPYKDSPFTISNDGVKSTTTDMAALSYPLQGLDITRSRLFYADQDNILQGFEKDGSQEWKPSAIGFLNAAVAPNSPITALVSGPANSIKVYYYGKDGKKKVAWWPDSNPWKTGSI